MKKIYVDQPERFIVKSQEYKVCKLLKFLYDLKHIPKQWLKKFDGVMIKDGFTINECDKCVYTK